MFFLQPGTDLSDGIVCTQQPDGFFHDGFDQGAVEYIRCIGMRGLYATPGDLFSHDGVFHQKEGYKIGGSASTQQGSECIRLHGSFKGKYNGSQQCPGRAGKHGRHSHKGSRWNIAIATRKNLQPRSEEHTSELQSLMRISYAVFCLK